MVHLQIWIQIITLIIGVGALIDLSQFQRRNQYQFLKPLWHSILFLNLIFFTALMSQYLFVNFFKSIVVFKSSLFMEISDPISTIFYVGLMYYLMSLSYSIQNKVLKARYYKIFMLMAAIVVIRTIIGLFFGHPQIIFQIINAIHNIVIFICVVLNILILAKFSLGKITISDGKKTNAVKSIGIFYLIGSLLIIFSSAFSRDYHGIISSLIYLSFNIFPIIWYRKNWADPNNNLNIALAENDWEDICRQYKISSRQREIIEFILKGKSNKDIAESLFIAPHTVKNHIYGLYQKLGVKSRMELVSFLLGHSKNGNTKS